MKYCRLRRCPSWVNHVIPAIPAYPVRPKSGLANARVYEDTPLASAGKRLVPAATPPARGAASCPERWRQAFRPVRLKWVPDKSKLVELLSPSLRQSFLVFASALLIHPRTETKAIFHMLRGNATVTFALLVDRQIAEGFRPRRF